MTIAKRKEEYKRIKEGKVDIVVGARSAIFAPIDNLGMVIIAMLFYFLDLPLLR